MTKRKLMRAAFIAVAVLALIGLWWSLASVHQIVLTQQQLQERIDDKLHEPITKHGVTVSAVQLDLSHDDIGLAIEGSTTKLHTTYSLLLTTDGDLRWDAGSGSFYFRPRTVKISNLHANGENVGGKVERFIDKWANSPKAQATKAEIAAFAEKETEHLVQQGTEKVLERIPVYRLPDTLKGHLIRLSLKSVTVHDGRLIAEISLWQLTGYVIAWAVILLLGLGLAVQPIRKHGYG